MRNGGLALRVLSFPVLFGAFGLAAACGSSTSSSGSGGSAPNDCFDYSSFNGMSPSASFSTDVLPILRQSCSLSSSCHGCDQVNNPGCTNPGIKPFMGANMSAGTLSSTQIAAIISALVGQPANLQASTDASKMVGNPDMSLVAASDPAHSFMMYKLDGNPMLANMNDQVTCATLTCAGTHSCGAAMPSGGPPIAQAERDTIRRWIAQGAKND
jgi:hypothetical protein